MQRHATRLRIALAFLREPQRVITVCLTVALGTLALVLADGFIDRTFHLFREDIIRAHFGHLQVLPATEGATSGANALGGPVRRRVEAALAGHRGSVVAARLSFAGLVAHGDRTVGFLGEGVEPAREASLSRALRLSAGALLSADDERGALLGEGLARSVGAEVGDRVTLLVTVPAGGINAVEVVVAGLFHTATKAYDDRALRVPMRVAQELTRADGVSRLMVLLPETEEAPAAAAALRQALSGEDVRVRLWSDLADFYNKTVELFSRQLGFVRMVILAIVLLATSNAMARNVLEQQREIGTMMALGKRRIAVARKFVGEALAMGIVGGVLGMLLAAAIASIVSAVGIPMPPPPGTTHGFTGGIDFSARSAFAALASVVAVCLVASLLPALRASRVSIVDALRADR